MSVNVNSNQKRHVAFVAPDSLDSLPSRLNERKCTDTICLILALLLNLSMAIGAVVLLDIDNFYKVTYPSDSDGRVCGIDIPPYPYLYYADPPLISRRVCVSRCPQYTDTELQCFPTDQIGCKFSENEAFKVSYYVSYEQETKNGYFCDSTDPELKSRLKENSRISLKNEFFESIWALKWSIPISIGLSFLFFLAVQFFPKHMNQIVLFGGIISLGGALINILVYSGNSIIVKLVLTSFCLFCIVLVIVGSCKYRNSLKIHVSFLQFASKAVSGRKLILIYIPIFLLVIAVFVAVLLLELIGLLSHGQPQFNKDQSLYYHLENIFLIPGTVVVAVQAIWGFAIIKEAFNFCISGNAAIWYLREGRKLKTTNWLENWESVFQNNKDRIQKETESVFEPFWFLTVRHLGSIVAAGFMSAVFSVGDSIYDILRPSKTPTPSKQKNQQEKHIDELIPSKHSSQQQEQEGSNFEKQLKQQEKSLEQMPEQIPQLMKKSSEKRKRSAQSKQNNLQDKNDESVLAKPTENSSFRDWLCCCRYTVDLIRDDTMAFIYLTGNSYCSSSRYCEQLCSESLLLDNCQNISRIYRLCSHCMLIGLLLIGCLFTQPYGSINLYTLFVIAVMGYFSSTFFVCLHSNAVEAMTIVYLLDEHFTRVEQEKNNHSSEGVELIKKMQIQNKLMEAIHDEREKQLGKKDFSASSNFFRKKSIFMPA